MSSRATDVMMQKMLHKHVQTQPSTRHLLSAADSQSALARFITVIN